MNLQRHRVIFSQVRGIWMAVQETARSRSPRSAASGSRQAGAAAMPAATPVAAALVLFAAPLPGLAQIIPDASAPGRERPIVLKAANGTPAIHIQAPSAAGVSRNRYRQFDLGQQGERGAILNNSRTAVQSQLGGALPGNPWLARGSAKVIVNEVRSPSPSRLSGALEVAGQRADVIIANPSGLVVNGLSLINAEGLTLAGGQPVYRADGSLESFRVQHGTIQIEGQGLDAAQADFAQVLARAIALNAGIWAQDLRLVTGTNHLAADSMLQPLHADGAPGPAEQKPQFALDVAQLGGMYARKIMLIGTEAGLGVRNAGVLLAEAGPLTLSADGQLRNAGTIASQGAKAELQLSTRGMDNSGRLSSHRDMLLVDGAGETLNSGSIEAGRELVMQAGQLSNPLGGIVTAPRLDIIATRLANAGRITQTGTQPLAINSLAIANIGEKAHLGTPVPAAGVPAAGAPAGPAAAQPPPPPTLARGQIHVAQRLANTGLLTANGAIDVKAIHSFANSAVAHLGHLHSEGLLDNRKGVLQLQRLTGAQASVLNQGGSIAVADDLRLVARQVDNTGGTIASARSLTAEVLALRNDAGTLRAAGDLTLQAQTLQNNRNARLVSQGASVRLRLGGALNNEQGVALAQQGLEVTSASLNNAGGTLQTTGPGSPLKITVSAGVDNSAKGLIQSSGDLQLSAGVETINNSTGALLAQQDLLIHSRGLVDNYQGHMQAGQKLSLEDAGVVAGTPLAQATQTLSNQEGRLFSSHSLNVKNQGLSGAGRLDALGDMNLNFAKDITLQGSIAANGKLYLNSAGQLTNQAQLLGGSGVEVAAMQIANQPGAQISAQKNTTLRAALAMTNRGLVNGQDTRLDADTLDNLGAGRIYGDHLSIAAKKLQNLPEPGANALPVIAARQDLDLGVPVIINQDGAALRSLGNMRFGESLDASRIATGNGHELNNVGAHIDAQGDINFDRRVVNNLNAGLRIKPFAQVENKSGEDLVAFPGKAPESAKLYKEIKDGIFLPYFEHRGRFYTEMGIQGYNSDGRMFKPAHIDRFPHIPPAAFIDPKTSYRNGAPFPDDAPLHLEPVGSPRFAQFGIAVPENYMATAPDPLHYGAVKDESGQIAWQSLEQQRTYEAAVKIYEKSIAAAQKLHEKILQVVKDDNRYTDSSREYTLISNIKQSIHSDKVEETKAAIIESGGNIHFKGLVNNVDSTVRAGARITHDMAPRNEGKQGNRKILTQGDAIRYHWEYRGGLRNKQKKYESAREPYSYSETKGFPLPTVVFKENHPYAPGAPIAPNSNTGTSAQRPTPVVREQFKESGERVRTLDLAGAVPHSSLYAIVAKPANPHQPLVETDPAFTRGRQWASSRQMLDALDPTLLQKRLGDGFYEQQLVQQQVGLLTGRRFLGDYRSNDAQYQALLQSGTTFAKAHGLRPGVALSAAQMAQLTSDLVWLVEEKVTLPDASEQTVLVPKVYVVARPGDLDIQGGLISADQLISDTDDDMDNSATLAGRRLVSIAAHDINNVAGNISGGQVGVHAKRDLNVQGATISATVALLASARRDLHAASTVSSTPGSSTVVDRKAAFLLIPALGGAAAEAAAPAKPGEPPIPSGLHLFAQRDAHLQGALISNAVEGSETSIEALRDIDLSAITTSHRAGAVWNERNRLLLGGSQEVGTNIDTWGNTNLHAGRNLHARAAQVASTAHLDVDAGTSVRIDPGLATRWLDDAYHSRRSGFLGSSSSTLAHQVQSTEAQPSFLGGKTVRIGAGKEIDMTASRVFSIEGTLLEAQGKVNLLGAQENASWQRQQHSRRSGVFGGGGLGLMVGSQRQSSEQSVQRTPHVPTIVGSLQGDVVVRSGATYRQIGSDVLAPQGNIGVYAKRIQIEGTPENEQGRMRSSFRQSGLGFSLSSPAIGLAQTASSLAEAASQTSDARIPALAAGAVALNTYNLRKELQALAQGDLGLRAEFALGRRKSQSHSAYASSAMRQSQMQAGGDIDLISSGDGLQSDLLIQDSQVDAGKVARLHADHQITMRTTPDTRSAHSSNSTRSAGVGLSLGAGGPAMTGSASQGTGRSESADQEHRQTQVNAGERAQIHSGGDTSMQDARIHALQVAGFVGGRLKIKSQQDTSRFDGRQRHQAGSFGMGPGLAAASGSYSTSRAQGDYASVKRPSGIFAGDGGFDLEVKDITELEGGVIASSQAAIDNRRNRLITRAILPTDMENRSDHSASGIHLSAGLATGGQQQPKSSGSDTVTHPTGWSAQNLGRLGVSAAAMGISSDHSRERSITRSGISPGAITITDEATQRALTGQSAAEAVANLHRAVRTDEPSPGLHRKWDGQRLMQEQAASAEIVAAFGQQASRALGSYVKEQMAHAANLRQQAHDNPENANSIINEAQKIEKEWGKKGIKRLSAHGAIGGLSAGPTGALGSLSGSVTAPLIANTLQQTDIPAPLADSLTALGSAFAGGLLGGSAGASTAFNEVTANHLYVWHMNILRLCLNGTNCKDEESKKRSLHKAEQISKKLDIKMMSHCSISPTSETCKKAVIAATQYIAMTEAWKIMKPDVSQTSYALFNHLYNSPRAREQFGNYFNEISYIGDFYRASNLYEKNIGTGAKWYGAAEMAIRSPLIGGGDLFTSTLPFAISQSAVPLSSWKKEASPAVMKTGFENFRNLYRNGNIDPLGWDIELLKKEQSMLQPIHKKYLSDKKFFVNSIKNLTDSNHFMSGATPENQKIEGGVNILDEKSRIQYGCKLLGYTENQGCKP